MPRAWDHYVLETLGDGIHAAVHRPGGTGVCNSGVIDLGEDGVVFDTGLSVASSKELRTLAEATLGRTPSMAANSHWHLDHSLGNQQFAGIPIWGTRRTREILIESADAFARDTDRTELERSIEQLERRRGTMPEGPPRRDLELNLLLLRALLEGAGTQRLCPPDQTFESRLRLPGPRRAELLSFGSGHTEADAVLHLPEDGVLFAGDLVCLGIQPSLGSGDPEHWLSVLDELGRLAVERLVPGHGPVAPPDRMAETRAYVSGVLEAARSSTGAALPAAIRRWEGSVSLEENLTFTRGWVAAHDERR